MSGRFAGESIAALLRRYREGHSPVDELRTHWQRIEAENPRLRAVVHVDREGALAAAQASLARWQNGTNLPLDGVPVSVKDIVDMAGIATRMGTDWLVPPPPAGRDAEVVGRLRAAGALVFAKTRLLEFAFGIVNRADGPVNNPNDTGRTAGGSSGGAAASVAAGIGYGAIGTDTGGSIRIPAAYCGVWGLEPTLGRVPTAGVFPLSASLDHVGPLARSADDLLRVFAVVADGALAPPRRVAPRLGVLLPYGRDPVTREVRDALARAVLALSRQGTKLQAVAVPCLAGSGLHAMRIIGREAAAVHRGYALRQSVRYAEGTLSQLRAGEGISEGDERDALAARDRLRAAVDAALAGLDALVMPTVGSTAPEKDPAFDDDEGAAEAWFTLPFNLTGHPALSLPLPDVAAMPIGLQLVGRTGEDEALVRTGEWLAARLSQTPTA